MTSKVHILILEDVETDAELLEDQLRKSNIDFRATWVDRGVSFSRALQVFQPDIVLSDLHLPRFSGMEALKIVRERAPSTPVIIVTGAVDDETAVNCLKAGAADYVLKDRLNRLGPAIHAALEKGRARGERARTEEALRESERHFRSLIENAQDMIIVLDEESKISYASPSVERILGYSSAEMTNTPAEDFVHPDDRETVRRTLTGAFAEPGTTHSTVLRLRCKDGRYLTQESIGSVSRDGGTPRSIVVNLRDVTDRVRALTQLQESELRFRAVAQSAADAIVCADADGNVIFWNDAAEKIFGYAKDEIVGKPLTTLIPERFRQAHSRGLEKAGRTRVAQLGGKPVELPGLRKDGSEFPLELSLASWTAGENVYFSAVIRDITERKQAENALKESQEKYRSLVDNLPAITYTSAIDGRSTRIYVSPQVEELLGLSPDEFIADPHLFAHCLHADDRERVLAAWANAYELGTALDLQYRMIHQDGRVRWFWDKATVLRERDGKPCRLQGIMLDVTESKEIERERDLLNAAIEQSTDSVIITDVDGTIEYMNPAFEQITGYSRGETIGRNPRYLQGGEHDSDFYREMWSTLKRGEPWSALFTNRRKDGTTYEQQSTIFPIRDASGATINYVQIGQDVSDRLEMERQLRQAQKMEAVGQLTGGIAHDFNNILTSVLANAELITDDVPQSHREVHQSAGEISEAAQRGAGLVKKLMAFSRQEHLRKEPLDLTSLCRETGATLRRVLPENIDLQIVANDGAGHIDGDPGAVEQILFNLATNARDAMPDGGSLTMTVERVAVDQPPSENCDCDTLGDYLCLSVSDTGVGMDDETKTKIFEPFFTTKPAGQGTGLGMAMVFGLVKEHGGCVTVDSEVRKGTTIKIYFPVGKDAAPPQVSPEPHLQARGGSETILLVEDERAVRRPARQVLERYGYMVLIAADGEQALEILRAPDRTIDLVLTDVIMPKMGGWELYQKAVANGDGPKFLFTSGYAAGQTGNGGQVDPTMPLLPKPWTTEQLLTEVRKVLEREVER